MKNIIRKALTFFLALIISLSVLSFTGCEKQQSDYVDFDYFEMDTYIKIRLGRSSGALGRLSEEYLTTVADECDRIIRRYEAVISAHDQSSELYAVNGDASMILGVSDELLSTLSTASLLSSLTDGAFDYTLGALTDTWNINGGGPVPTAEAITEALSHSGRDKFTVNGDTITKNDNLAKMDLGGVGKGIATQLVLEYLATTDVSYGLVSLGGNIGIFGEKPEYGSYKIGVRDPDDETAVIGYMYLTSGYVSVSGDYERFFEADGKRYHHILDPKTGRPAESGVRSVAVRSSNGAAADALSTALFVLGPEKSLSLYEENRLDFEAIFVMSDGSIVTTPGIDEDNFMLTNEKYDYRK